MYHQFFSSMGLHEDPFHACLDPRFYYATAAHKSALSELLYGIATRQGFLLLTGEAGTGKTFLLNQILDWLRQHGLSSAYIFHTHLEPTGLFRFILDDFDVPYQSNSKSDLVNVLHTWLLQRHAAMDLPVLILDEAQVLSSQTLDELRLLLNLETPGGKLLQIILSGQPELEEKLRQPALRQLRQRIMFHSRLTVLTQEETAAYISNRLATVGCAADSSLFPDEVVQDIYRSSGGIPRIVNLLCEHAIITACAEGRRAVSRDMIQRISVDFGLPANPLSGTGLEVQPHFARLATFPVIETLAQSSVSVQHASREQPVPAVHTPFPLESPKPVVPRVGVSTLGTYSEIPTDWQRPRLRSKVAVFARTTAIHRAWHAFTPRFARYLRSVSHSFMRDFRSSFRVLALLTSALESGSSAQVANEKPVTHRNILVSVLNWLRNPFTPGTIFGDRSPARSARRR
jgi:general secretion pathway protein A